jgi:anti-anti-sigma factor
VKTDIQKLGSVTIVSPRSAITQGEVEGFAALLEEHRHKSNGRLVLEFCQVPFVDSRAVEVLWDFADQQRAGGQTAKLAGVPELCREILELTGVAAHLDLFDSSESAVRSFL